jgi:hypothetical protein
MSLDIGGAAGAVIEAGIRARAECGTLARPVPALLAAFRELMELGMPMKHAAHALSISETALYKWVREIPEWGKAAEIGRAAFVRTHLKRITDASQKGTWQASGWLLERCQPEYFSRAREIAMGSAMGGALSSTILAQMASEIPVATTPSTEEQGVISTTPLTIEAAPVGAATDIGDEGKATTQPDQPEGGHTPPSPLPKTVSPLSKKISAKKAPRHSRSPSPSEKSCTKKTDSHSVDSDPFSS